MTARADVHEFDECREASGDFGCLVEPMADVALRITEALKRAGVSVHVALDDVQRGAFVISDVPRGRRPTIERVMATFSHRWRFR